LEELKAFPSGARKVRFLMDGSGVAEQDAGKIVAGTAVALSG
jgi:hypothetical protein